MYGRAWLVLFGLMSGFGVAHAGQTSLVFFGEANEYVSQGQQYRLTTADGSFSIASPDAGTLTLSVENLPALSWQLKLAAADGQSLSVGSFESAQREGSQEAGHPGLDFFGDGRGCNTVTGRFDVLELVRDGQGNVIHLAVHFEQHCEGGLPALIGEVRYDSDVPITPFVVVENPLNSQGCVMAAGPHPAPVRLTLANAVDSTGGSLLDYAWSSSTGAAGTAAQFQAPIPLGATASIDVTLTDLLGGRVVQLSREVCVSKSTSLFYHRPGGGPDYNPDLAERIEANDRPFQIDDYDAGNTLQVLIPWSQEHPEQVTATFAAPGSAPLAVGSYDNATGYPATPGSDQSALTFSPANAVESGRFQVLELVRNPDGQVISLAVNFEAHRMFSSEIFYGQIRYNSAVPVTPVISVESPQATDDCIDVSTPPGPAVKLRAHNGYDAHGGEQVSYRWASSTGATGTGAAFQFVGAFEAQPQITLTMTDLVTRSDTVLTRNLCIDPPSMLHLESQLGDPVGAGQNTTLWPPTPITGSHAPFVVPMTTGADNGAILTIGGLWNLQLGSGSTDPLTIGVYENAHGGSLNDGTAPYLAFESASQLVCFGGYTGRFEILDIQRDAQSGLARLAVDFEQTCSGSSGKLTGQLRYKSSVSFDPNQTDLTVSVTAPAEPPQLGQQGSYRLTVTNQGALPATQPVVTVTLPSLVTTAALPANCQATGPGLSCSLDSLFPGATAILDLNLVYQSPGRGTIGASVAADTVDFDPSNNQASQLATVPIDPATIETQVAAAMDPSVDPCQDFYSYACGGWINHQPLPDYRSYLVRGPDAASDDVRAKLYLLLQSAAEAPGLDADRQRIGSFFGACMDETQAEQDGLTGLQPLLTKIDQIANRGDFLQVAGELTRAGAPTLIFPFVAPDIRSFPTQYIVFAYAGQPGYPDGDVYLRHDPLNKTSRAALNGYIAKVLGQFGEVKPLARARDVLRIEKTVVRFDPSYGMGGRLALVPSSSFARLPLALPWNRYLDGLGLKAEATVVVDRSYLQTLDPLLAKMPLNSLKAYLRWQAVAKFLEYLPKAFHPDNPISGIAVGDLPRWQSCVDATSYLLGDAVGKMLVDSEATSAQIPLAQELLDGARNALAAEATSLPFLANAASRSAVQQKLDGLVTHLGYPDSWPISAGSDTAETSYLGKVAAAGTDITNRRLAMINQAVQRTQWNANTGVQTVNAYNNIWTNEIYLFAGMLRPPFMDTGYPLAMNYAALGTVVAHELVHGFDANGRNFGANGNLDPLLSGADNRRYDARAQCFVKQYSRFSGGAGTKVNGKKTLNENLADNGGLHLAYQAFKTALTTAHVQPTIANLTPQQLFFTAYAQMYCEASTPESARYRYSRTWNRYAPWKYRAIAPLMNSTDFSEAFNCPASSAMNPGKKCSLW
ncbi:MAG: hypothetical protein FIA97_09785 [Methylococcaceae bacterium]|nr:hypothetical protein [Methylococcaceae bacterium]